MPDPGPRTRAAVNASRCLPPRKMMRMALVIGEAKCRGADSVDRLKKENDGADLAGKLGEIGIKLFAP